MCKQDLTHASTVCCNQVLTHVSLVSLTVTCILLFYQLPWRLKYPLYLTCLSPGECSTAHRSNRSDHWDGLMLDGSAVVHRYPVEQNVSNCRQPIHYIVYRSVLPAGDTLYSVSAAGNRCHFVLLDKDESDLSNIGRPDGLAYSTGELLNMPLVSCHHAPLSVFVTYGAINLF